MHTPRRQGLLILILCSTFILILGGCTRSGGSGERSADSLIDPACEAHCAQTAECVDGVDPEEFDEEALATCAEECSEDIRELKEDPEFQEYPACFDAFVRHRHCVSQLTCENMEDAETECSDELEAIETCDEVDENNNGGNVDGSEICSDFCDHAEVCQSLTAEEKTECISGCEADIDDGNDVSQSCAESYVEISECGKAVSCSENWAEDFFVQCSDEIEANADICEEDENNTTTNNDDPNNTTTNNDDPNNTTTNNDDPNNTTTNNDEPGDEITVICTDICDQGVECYEQPSDEHAACMADCEDSFAEDEANEEPVCYDAIVDFNTCLGGLNCEDAENWQEHCGTELDTAENVCEFEDEDPDFDPATESICNDYCQQDVDCFELDPSEHTNCVQSCRQSFLDVENDSDPVCYGSFRTSVECESKLTCTELDDVPAHCGDEIDASDAACEGQ